jgi:isopentenyl-diphosphate delta-isomerase
MEHVVLVDADDNAIGTMEKLEAHQKGVLHRAFSILLFNSRGEWLLQKRAQHKYHSGGLWTNTCCSHPLPGETMEQATQRKLKQEMGIDLKTEFAYKFTYQTELDHGLVEHELDYVFTGTYDGIPEVNAHEVEDWKFVAPDVLKKDISAAPQNYTHWFKLIVAHNHVALARLARN